MSKGVKMNEERDEIKCIFFSEFHPTAGPKIVYQVPEDYIKKEEFDAIHVYIITKPELQNRTITINALGHKLVGCPVFLDNPKYARNALIFNLCFVFDASANTVQHESVVKKLASYLTTLENENGFLSKEDTKQEIPSLLAKILDDLNEEGSCEAEINESTSISLMIVPPQVDPPTVMGHQVPIMNIKYKHFNVNQWDLATQQLLPYFDGYKQISRIGVESDVDINIVKACVQNLVYLGVLKIISIFQYSNVYMCCPEINKLIEDEDLQEECLTYVAKPGKEPHFRDVFQLYCSLTAGTTVRDLCSRFNPHSQGVDERKLIQYGLMNGLIRRLEKYPVKLLSELGTSKSKHYYKWFNGRHSYDEICCKTGLSYHDLDEKVESDPSIVVCWK